jgi:hypothetical protein
MRIAPYSWQGREIELSSQDTSKGLRYFLVCPKCKKGRIELRCYFPKFEDSFICCKQCDPYDKTPYAERTNLNDNSGTDLIQYHIENAKEKLYELGVEIQTYFGELRQKNNEVGCSYPEVFDYQSHLCQRPKNRKVIPFKRKLVKLQLLYDLWNNAYFDGICYTGTDIRKYTDKKKIDDFIRKSEAR